MLFIDSAEAAKADLHGIMLSVDDSAKLDQKRLQDIQKALVSASGEELKNFLQQKTLWKPLQETDRQYISFFSECLQCFLSRTHEPQHRAFFENLIVQKCLEYELINKFADNFVYVGFGPGDLLQDFIILNKLVAQAKSNKKINLTIVLIDVGAEYTKYEHYVEGKKNLDNIQRQDLFTINGKTINHLVVNKVTNAIEQLVRWFGSDPSIQTQVIVYTDAQQYIEDTMMLNKLKADILVAADLEDGSELVPLIQKGLNNDGGLAFHLVKKLTQIKSESGEKFFIKRGGVVYKMIGSAVKMLYSNKKLKPPKNFFEFESSMKPSKVSSDMFTFGSDIVI